MKYETQFLCLLVGLIVGQALPQGFFKPWYDNSGDFYGGEPVGYIEGGDTMKNNFYRQCKSGKVEYVHNQQNILVRWKDCEFPDIIYKEYLSLHSKEDLSRP